MSGPHFTAIVKLALRRELASFRADRPGVTLTAVTVLTATPPELTTADVRGLLRREHLDAAEVVVDVDPTTAPPGFRIRLDAPPPPPVPTGAGGTRVEFATAVEPEHVTVPPGDFFVLSGKAVLVLCFGSWRWTYPLVTSQAWIPLGRGLVSDGRRSTVRVPDFMNAIPRGTLLHIRHAGGTTHVRRAPTRAEYVVSVDGRPLAAGAQIPLQRSGAVEYGTSSAPGVSTTLRYELT